MNNNKKIIKKGKYDFSGYATKNGVLCDDGRIIVENAFKHQDGQRVSLVWQHLHDDPSYIIGYADLENKKDGTYCHCSFNDTPRGKIAKELVAHGDIKSLSVFANKLKQQMVGTAKHVMHGMIREVSLVISGANPMALIDDLCFAHSGDDRDLYETIIYYSDSEFSHGSEEPEEPKEPTIKDVLAGLSEEHQQIIHKMLQTDDPDKAMQHATDENKTLADVYDTLSEEQQALVVYMVHEALTEPEGSAFQSGTGEDIKNDNGGKESMKHHVFEKKDKDGRQGEVLCHDGTTRTTKEIGKAVVENAKRYGSLRESFLAHASEYGFDPIDVLFPEAQLVRPGAPDAIRRETGWVAGVLATVKKTPFSRIKSRIVDLTYDEARAKGYITGNRKKEEVLPLFKRTTNPTTIYKKQKLDRDDIVEITDFDIIAWLKVEMRGMLDEELARAILIGDGRAVDSEDHISTDNIRPIAMDNPDVYVVRHIIKEDATYADMIDEIIRSRKKYRGSGSPNFYTNSDIPTEFLLIKDLNQRDIYLSEAQVASKIRVREIVEVEPMNDATMEINGVTYEILGILTNLADYTVGSTKGGQVNFFDDFDIDYNQEKYLIETRCSGALTLPKSAIVYLRKKAA